MSEAIRQPLPKSVNVRTNHFFARDVEKRVACFKKGSHFVRLLNSFKFRNTKEKYICLPWTPENRCQFRCTFLAKKSFLCKGKITPLGQFFILSETVDNYQTFLGCFRECGVTSFQTVFKRLNLDLRIIIGRNEKIRAFKEETFQKQHFLGSYFYEKSFEFHAYTDL